MTEASFQIDPPDSVIITLEPDPESRVALRVEDGVPDAIPAKEYHLTLVRVGGIAETKNLSDILQSLLGIAANTAPMMGDVSGAGFFGPDGFNGNTVMLVDIDGLTEFRNELVDALLAANVSVDEDYDFIPHITVAKGPVIAPESKVGTELSFGNFGLRFGPQAALVPFMLEPEPVMVPEVVPEPLVEGEVPVPDAGLEAPEGTAAASVEDVGKNAEAVDGLMSRLVEEFGKFLQGPGGKFIGSEPEGGGPVDGPEDPIGGGPADPLGPLGGEKPSAAVQNRTREYPFGDRDKAGTLDPAGDWDNLDTEGEQQLVESVFMSGGEIDAVYTQATEDGGMGMVPLENLSEQGAERAYEAAADEMDRLATPATEEIAITTTASLGQYEYNPETGKLSGGYGESDQLPIGATPPVIVGYGNPTAAVGEAAASGDMPVQIVVTPGTPIINGGVGQVADKSAGTAVALPSSAKVTITGQTVDPFGQPMLLATATAYEPGEARWR